MQGYEFKKNIEARKNGGEKAKKKKMPCYKVIKNA